MKDASRMSSIEGIPDLNRVVERELDRQDTSRDGLLQGFTNDILHHDKVHAFFTCDFMDDDDVFVIERRCRFGFLDESLSEAWGTGDPWREQLSRHETVEVQILGFVDLAHAAAPDRFDHP